MSTTYFDFIDVLTSKQRIREILVELELFDKEPASIQVKQLLVRSLFMLNSNILYQVSTITQQFQNATSIGIQIRTGGSLANNQEQSAFFTQEKLFRIHTIVTQLLNSEKAVKGEFVLFLSSDSEQVISSFRKQFKHRIVVTDFYRIGHSSRLRGGTRETFFRAVMDIQILSQCDYLLTTYTSSFGNAASYLSHSMNKLLLNYKD